MLLSCDIFTAVVWASFIPLSVVGYCEKLKVAFPMSPLPSEFLSICIFPNMTIYTSSSRCTWTVAAPLPGAFIIVSALRFIRTLGK